MMLHLLCYQAFAVNDYDFTPDAADMEHHSQRQASLNFRSIEALINKAANKCEQS